jgi:hypothetical protein
MDKLRFDELTKCLANGTSRRQVVKGLFGGVLGLGAAGALIRNASAQGGEGDQCETDDDCDGLLICDTDLCYGGEGYVCDDINNCAFGFDCISGTCQAEVVADCTDDDDCEDGEVCNEGVCEASGNDDCTVNSDCVVSAGESGLCCAGQCVTTECCGTGDTVNCGNFRICTAAGVCEDVEEPECESDDDCEDPLVCVQGACVTGGTPCEDDTDCVAEQAGEGAICCAGFCREIECCIDDEDPNARCPDGTSCFEGVCDEIDNGGGTPTLPNTGAGAGGGSSASLLLGAAALAGGAALLGGKKLREGDGQA